MLGKIVYSDYGNFTLTIPVKNIYGDYKLEGSWGSMGPGLLTECYSNGNCDNNTLHVVTPNFVKFADIHNNMISLTRVTQYPANLIGARLIDNLLSQQNHNGIVLPAVNFPGYIDLSNPAKVRPNITVINDPTYQQRWNETREMNSTATTWTIYNTTSGSTGTIKFTDCVLQNETGYLAGCPNNPPTYYRILHGHLEQECGQCYILSR